MGFQKKCLFLCGQIGIMLLVRFFLQWVIDFASWQVGDIVLFSAASVGAALLAFRVFDGVTDPLAGILGDAWVKQGRARKNLLWFFFAAPPIGLMICFLPDHGMVDSMRWAYLLGGMFLFFVGYTFYAIPYWSLIDDYAEGDRSTRRSLSNLLGAGVMIATGIGFVVTPFMVDRFGYLYSAMILAGIASVLMILPIFAAPKSTSAPQRLAPSDHAGHALESFKLALTHRRFLAVMIIFAGSQMSFTVMTAAAPFLAIDLLGGTRADVAKLLGPLLVVSIPSFLITAKISARWGWEKAVVVASIALGGVYAATGTLSPDTPIQTAMIMFAVGGPMVAILLGLEGEAITECAEERGGDAVSLYFGVYNFIIKACNGVAIWVAGMLAEYARGDMGVVAVRAMSWVAGGFLVVGVALYFTSRPKAPKASLPSP